MHPAVFATFTAPSCGSCIPGLEQSGKVARCQPVARPATAPMDGGCPAGSNGEAIAVDAIDRRAKAVNVIVDTGKKFESLHTVRRTNTPLLEAAGRPQREHTRPGFQATVSSQVAVTGTACLSEPSKDIASTRGENQWYSTALPAAIG
jgi:hypothetical protein